MKPCSHYLRYPIGETGWALMKILLNIAGWFLYFAQWQKSRYPCQFTLNSASCQGSLYQGASNAHPLLNDSKATSPDRRLTTPVMHTQDTLARAGNTPGFSTESVALFAQTLWDFSRTFEWPSVETRLGVCVFTPRRLYFSFSSSACNHTQAVMSFDAHHLMFTARGGCPTLRKTMSLNVMVLWAFTYVLCFTI